MDNLNLKRINDGTIELSAFGLKLSINPKQLVSASMNANSQKILDSIIEDRYRNAIKEFAAWRNQEYLNPENAGVDYKLQVKVDAIQELADMARHILPLHSDSDILAFSREERDWINEAHQFWKYNRFYGFESEKEVNLNQEKKIS